MKKNILKQFSQIGIGTILTMLIGLMTTPIITRVINPVDYGAYSLFNTYTNIGTMVFCLGMDQALVRFYYNSDTLGYKSGLVYKVIKMPIVVLVFSAFITYVVYYVMASNSDFLLLTLLILNIIIHVLYRFSLLVVRLEYKSKAYSILTVVGKLTYVLFALLIFLMVKESSSLILMISIILSTLFSLLFSIFINKKIWNPFNRKPVKSVTNKEIIKYSFPFIFSLGVTTLFQANDKLFLNYFRDTQEVGIFSSAVTIASLLNIIRTTFTTVWSPLSIEKYNDNPENKDFFKNVNQIITVIMFIIGITVILFKDTLVLFLGEEYKTAAFILPFLIFDPIMYTVSETTVIGLIFKKKSKFQINVAVLVFIVDVILNTIFIPSFGAVGAALSTSLSYIVFFFIRTYYSQKLYYVNYEIKNILILIILTFLFALYNSYNSINLISIFFYIIIMSFILKLYKNVIKDLIKHLHSIY